MTVAINTPGSSALELDIQDELEKSDYERIPIDERFLLGTRDHNRNDVRERRLRHTDCGSPPLAR